MREQAALQRFMGKGSLRCSAGAGSGEAGGAAVDARLSTWDMIAIGAGDSCGFVPG